MRRIIFLSISLIFTSISNANQSDNGLEFYSTRLIYNESDKSGVTFSIKNNSKNNYLVQAWISDTAPINSDNNIHLESERPSPFIILPPLKKIHESEKMSWKIIQRNKITNTKTESVYYVYLKAIPSFENEENSKIAINTVLVFKLFYRPDSLEIKKINRIIDKLDFSKDDSYLTVKNNSPLYATFNSISIGDERISENELIRMVPPYGSQKYLLPKNYLGKINWSLINELSGTTDLIEQKL